MGLKLVKSKLDDGQFEMSEKLLPSIPLSDVRQGRGRLGSATFSALKVRNFRLYFFSQIISNSGTWMQMIAQSWLVLQLSKSGVVLGLVSAVQFAPILFFSPLAGVFVDRADKRRLMLMTQSLFAVLALILGIVVEAQLVQLWMVFVVALLMGFVNAFDTPARQSFVIEMVGPKELSNAVSLNAVVMNSARVIGPSIAGAIIFSFGIGMNFFLNSASFLAVLLMLVMLRKNELMPAKPSIAQKGQLREGFSYVRRTPVLLVPLLMMVIVGTIAYEFQISLPLFTTKTFHLGASSYATMTACLGIGAVVGGLVVATFAKPSLRLLIIATTAFGTSMIITSVMPTFDLALVATAVMGAVSILFLSTANALLQISSLPEMRGRVMALYTVAFLGTTPIGAPVVGLIAQYFGGRAALAVGGVATIAAGGLGILSVLRHRAQRRLRELAE